MAEYLCRTRDQTARDTLKWLVAAQRPVTVLELHAITHIARVQGCTYSEAAAQFMSKPSHDTINVEERKAVIAIEELLGEKVLEYTREPALENALCARLALGSRKVEINGEDFFDVVPDIRFTKAEAHNYALEICLGICRVTTISFGKFRNERPHLFGLVTYAWTYWSAHHFFAFNRNPPPEKPFLYMIPPDSLHITTRNVLLDTFNLLTDLNTHLIHLATQSTLDRAEECVLITKDALDLLDTPLSLLSKMNLSTSALVHNLKYPDVNDAVFRLFEDLSLARRACPNFIFPQPADGAPATDSLSRTPFSSIHYNMVPATEPADKSYIPRSHAMDGRTRIGVPSMGLATDYFLGAIKDQADLEGCMKTLVVLAETARHLKLLCLPISQSLVFEELLGSQANPISSPLDTLVNVACFLEALACYPFRDFMHKAYSDQYLEIANPNLESSVDLVRYRDWARSEKPFVEYREDRRVMLSGHTPTRYSQLSVSQRLILQIKGHKFPSRNTGHQNYQTAVVNHDAKPVPPPGAATLAELHRDQCFDGLGPVDWVYLRLKSALISDGCILALAKLAMAIVANHVRTIFVPWLVIGIWQNPLEQLRLARSNPEVFLDTFYAQTWTFQLFSLAVYCILDSFAFETLERVVIDQSVENRVLAKYRGEYPTLRFVGYITWVFTIVEYLFSAGVILFAMPVAFWNLVWSESETAHLALSMVTSKHSRKMMFMAVHILIFSGRAIPILRIAIRSAADGRVGFSLFIGGLVALVRAIILHRSFFFLALEVSGMFVAAGWFLVGCWIMLAWFWDDPVGIKRSVENAVHNGEIMKSRLAYVLADREEMPDFYGCVRNPGEGL